MLIFPLLMICQEKSSHIDMDAFFAAVESEIILNSEENLSLSAMTLGKQVGVVSFPLVAMRRELLVSIQP